jgi:hypothetical protein
MRAAHVLLALAAARAALAQQPPPAAPQQGDLFTAPDGAFDVSGFLSTRVGFLPIAMPITEPAVGYGLALGLTYFHDEPARLAATDGTRARTIMPSTSALFGATTENDTWAVGGAHLGIWDQGRARYVGAVGYANLELDWYGRDDAFAGRSVHYTNEALFVYQSLKLQLGDSPFFAGPLYRYFGSDATFDAGAPSSGIPSPELESATSGIGLVVGHDDLDHPYSPTRGLKVDVTATQQAEALGGDFDYTQIRSVAIGYVPLSPRFVLGARANADFTIGDAPFYDLSTILLRGIPKLRYVDDDALYGETELRWDFAERWTALAFAGAGAVGGDLGSLGETHFAGGIGGRYLIASRYGLRMGVDVAHGDDEWTVYVGIGTGWVRP